MLVKAIIWAVIPVVDLTRATRFYGEILGLTPLPTRLEGMAEFKASEGTRLALYERPASPANHTLACFEVTDIKTAQAELGAKGIQFEEYDMPGLKTVDGIATIGADKAAWFKDSEGNILGLSQTGN